ncbi:hypothetical protein [Bartonella sp. DGB2]|uniref:hypothetical protein n=1 Tax=Bartonella sp. DGB2 TaxID=3388426 RepID=UPI0039900CEE
MLRLIIYGLICAITFYAYRIYKAGAERLTRRAKQVKAEQRTSAKGTLVWDEATGEYRLARR